ncbi:MAG: S41 family peptidase [Planctomycetota bacterium]|jgi:tricorn protease
MLNARRAALWLLIAFTGCVHAGDSPSVDVSQGTGTVLAVVPSLAEASQSDRPAGRVDLPRFPSISPDGQWVVFSWRGDLWKVASAGGHAERLTTHVAEELHSAFSADGRRIAFDSDRNGSRNIFLMNADGTAVQRVTTIDQNCVLSGMGIDSAGNEVVTFEGSLEGDIYRSPRPYMCAIGGGEIVRIHDAFGAHPRINRDGSQVLFTRGGSRWSRRHYRGPDSRNVWLYDRGANSFSQLTSWSGNDGKACWAGDRVVFLSDRELDTFNLYAMEPGKGGKAATRLTSFSSDDVQDFDISADGARAVLSAWDKLYTLDLTARDAQPVELQLSANEDEADNFKVLAVNKKVSEAALSPDGKVMAYVACGEVYVRNIEKSQPTRRVTNSHARERQLAWSPNGLHLYFVSDRDGTESIYRAAVALTRGEVKEEFAKATNNESEDTQGGSAAGTDDDVKEASPGQEAEVALTDTDEDPEEEEEGDDDKKNEDKKSKEPELPRELRVERWQDALRFDIEPVIAGVHNDRMPRPSPEGKYLAFRRGRGDLVVHDIESGEQRLLVTGWDGGIDWRWSPDGRHVAYQQNDMNFNSDIWIVPVDESSPPVNITRHPDDDFNPRWSADGRILSFISERVGEEYDLWMVYLDKDLEAMTPAEREKYYEEAAKAAKKRKPLKIENPEAPKEDKGKEEEESGRDNESDEEITQDPVTLHLDDAYLRIRRVTSLNGNEGNNEITPGGDRYIFTALIGESGLYSVRWDGKERKKLGPSASVQHVSLTGDKIVVVEGGRAGTVKPDGKKIEYVEIKDKIRVDLQQQATQKFLEMARILGENFYHPTMKDLDWAKLTRKYLALARQTRTASEFNHVGMRLFGELNGSHLGVYSRGPTSANAQPFGHLGTVHRRAADGYKVLGVIPQTPADTGPMALVAGDLITAVEMTPFAPADTLEARLEGRVGKETLITIKRRLEDGSKREVNVLVTPISRGALNQLKYRAWRRENAERVAEWSNGRIGYIHVQAMGQAALDVFERDLFAAAGDKDGLIIDVRNNGGGWTADRLLSSIMVQPHAYTIPRGASPDDTGHYPQDRLFIQRYTLPTNMLCNEKSFSNAEIVSHAFKTLKRGTLVGQQTYGGVISTGGTSLIDGTWVRLPFRGWHVVGGMDMENNGAIPDLLVAQTPDAEAAGRDDQLRAAVDDLMGRIN